MIKQSLDADEYDKLIEKASQILRDYPHIDPYDIVNEVVLKAIEAGGGLYLHELIQMVRYEAKSSGANKKNAGSFKDGVIRNSKVIKSEQYRVCSKCHESLPISAFSIVKRKIGKGDAYSVITEILYNCKECQKKISKAARDKKKKLGIKTVRKTKVKRPLTYKVKQKLKSYREKNKLTSKYKNKNKERVENWLQKEENREKWNAYMRERYKEKGRKDRKKGAL